MAWPSRAYMAWPGLAYRPSLAWPMGAGLWGLAYRSSRSLAYTDRTGSAWPIVVGLHTVV